MGSETFTAAVDIALQLGLGLALAAACGFRVFVPPLVLSAAALTGHVHLAGAFAWLGTPEALAVLGVATVLEIGAYLVPWLDNLLDALAAPAAVVAGILMSASVMTGMDPLFRWTLAVVAGGGAAGLVHGSLAALRGVSTLASGGLTNHLVAAGEAAGAVVVSVLALFAPALAVLALFAGCALLLSAARRRAARPTEGTVRS